MSSASNWPLARQSGSHSKVMAAPRTAASFHIVWRDTHQHESHPHRCWANALNLKEPWMLSLACAIGLSNWREPQGDKEKEPAREHSSIASCQNNRKHCLFTNRNVKVLSRLQFNMLIISGREDCGFIFFSFPLPNRMSPWNLGLRKMKTLPPWPDDPLFFVNNHTKEMHQAGLPVTGV